MIFQRHRSRARRGGVPTTCRSFEISLVARIPSTLPRASFAMSHAWRSLLFGLEGWRHFLKSGYDAAAKSFDNACFERDLRGRVFVITGANQGIGLETARRLALQRASVHMVCRDAARGEAALSELRDEVRAAGKGDGDALRLSVLDVSDQRAVRAFCADYVASGAPVHALVNNAGCMIHERTHTEEGVETNYATNTLGAWALIEGLLPALRRTGRADVVGAEGANSSLVGDARVIFVASAGALTERLETTDVEMCPPRAFDGTRQYAKNKRQQLALVERWARAEPDVGFFAMHPGWADTAALRAAMPAFRDALAAKLRTPREGADTVAWLCVASRDDLKSGGFYLDRKIVSPHLGWGAGTRHEASATDALVDTLGRALERALGARANEKRAGDDRIGNARDERC